ncbi:unnamed protein product, partial [Oikopleura dioica]
AIKIWFLKKKLKNQNIFIFISKQNLSIAVIGMNSNNSSELEAEKSQCPVEFSSNSSEQEIFLKNEFSWTEKQEMLLLGCYYYGYVIFHMVGGWIGFKFGFKKLLRSSLIGAFINLVFPFSIRLSFTFGVALRIALGISHSGSSAAMTEAWSKWAPQDEKSFLLNFIFSGMTFGLLLTNLAGGWIIQSFNWPVIFYIPAICTFFWAAIWHFRVSETPEEHKTIDKEELDLIISTRSGQKTMKKNISFLKLFTFLPVWGFIIGCVGKDFAAFTAMQMFPMYMNRKGLNFLTLAGKFFFAPLRGK